jgi:hypothetical protein
MNFKFTESTLDSLFIGIAGALLVNSLGLTTTLAIILLAMAIKPTRSN